MEHLREGTDWRKHFLYLASKTLIDAGGLPEGIADFFKLYIGIYEAGTIDCARIIGL